MSTDADVISLSCQTCDDTARCTRAKAVITCHPMTMIMSNLFAFDFSVQLPNTQDASYASSRLMP